MPANAWVSARRYLCYMIVLWQCLNSKTSVTSELLLTRAGVQIIVRIHLSLGFMAVCCGNV